MSAALSRKVVAVAFLCLLAFLAFDVFPWLIKDRIADGSASSERWRMWLSTFAGNWSPEAPHATLGPWEFAYSAVAAILINNSLAVVATLLVWRLFTEWRQRMKLNQVFAARDQTAKQLLYSKLPNDVETIKQAFKESQELWHAELVTLFGQGEADRLKSMMNKEI